MGMAKYKEDNVERWLEATRLKSAGYNGITLDGLVMGYPYQKKTASPKRNTTIKTDGFIITGNSVHITTGDTKTFYALLYSLKGCKGVYSKKKQSWILTEQNLERWINTQREYGWFS